MLELDGLLLRQGEFTLAADFTVQPGSRIAVLGPSGGGKSTLLAALGGFLTPVSGRILWDGRDITKAVPAERPVSILFQDNNLFPHLSVAANAGLGLKPSLRLTRDERDAVAGAIESVGLGGLEDRRPSELSGGQMARAALARILLRRRPLLLLDEPFSALGPGLRVEMLDLVRALADAQNLTVMMVTHNPTDALKLEAKTVFVASGEASPPRETQDLLENPPAELQAYLE